jgi:hypothetical protein
MPFWLLCLNHNLYSANCIYLRIEMWPVQLAVYFLPLALVVYRVLQIGKRDPRMPRGPPTIPILGNAHLVPNEGLFKQ